jgi:hypothetical protein
VIIYKSPLSRIQVLGILGDSRGIEEQLLRENPREPETRGQAKSERGVFVRPLEEEAFEKHVGGLEIY